MKAGMLTQRILNLLTKNWFTLALLVLSVIIISKRDISFQLDLGQVQGRGPVQTGKTTETPLLTSSTADVDQLELPIDAGFSKKATNHSALSTIDETTRVKYLARFRQVALAEQKKFHIPASVILATALYQSNAGKSKLAVTYNNQFGLTCLKNGSGSCERIENQHYQNYETAWESFRSFSLFTKENFAPLKGKNYKTWAKAMEKSGFGIGENFSTHIIGIIENYRLHELDASNYTAHQ